MAVAMTWPDVRKLAFISPDYSYGRNAFDHFRIAIGKLLPDTEVVSEAWPKLGTTDFTAHITKTISAKPDLLVSSVWGGDYIAFYKQALGYGLFEKMKFASTIAFGVAPHAIGKDHPQGVIAGVHANYYWNFPPGNKWPINTLFVRKYYNRWKEYPNFEAEGAYTAVHMLRMAIARANRLAGGWPDDDAIIHELEGLPWDSLAASLLIPLAGSIPVRAGHELPYYPSFYPHEIQLTVSDAGGAAEALRTGLTHATPGTDPFGGALPQQIAAAASWGGYVVLTFSREAIRSIAPPQRCALARDVAGRLDRTVTGFIVYPYPVTPYHGDYLY